MKAEDFARRAIAITRFARETAGRVIYYRARSELAAAYLGQGRGSDAKRLYAAIVSDIGLEHRPLLFGDIADMATQELAGIEANGSN